MALSADDLGALAAAVIALLMVLALIEGCELYDRARRRRGR